jgi:hypothetical protein
MPPPARRVFCPGPSDSSPGIRSRSRWSRARKVRIAVSIRHSRAVSRASAGGYGNGEMSDADHAREELSAYEQAAWRPGNAR